MLVCISDVFGFCEIHSGPLGGSKGPGIEHICHFCHNFGCFTPKFTFSMYLLHSNVSLRYPLGTGQYFNCFWLLINP